MKFHIGDQVKTLEAVNCANGSIEKGAVGWRIAGLVEMPSKQLYSVYFGTNRVAVLETNLESYEPPETTV